MADEAAPPEQQEEKETDDRGRQNQRKRQKAVDPRAKASAYAIHQPCSQQSQKERGDCGHAGGGQRDPQRRIVDGQRHGAAIVNPCVSRRSLELPDWQDNR
jgi:hypothetical protein